MVQEDWKKEENMINDGAEVRDRSKRCSEEEEKEDTRGGDEKGEKGMWTVKRISTFNVQKESLSLICSCTLIVLNYKTASPIAKNMYTFWNSKNLCIFLCIKYICAVKIEGERGLCLKDFWSIF